MMHLHLSGRLVIVAMIAIIVIAIFVAVYKSRFCILYHPLQIQGILQETPVATED